MHERVVKAALPGDLNTHLQGFHEGLRPRLGDGSQVVYQVSLSHADSRVHDGQSAIVNIGDDVNLQVLPTVQLGGVSQAFISNFIQCLVERVTVTRYLCRLHFFTIAE